MALLPIIDDMRSYGEHWLGAECERIDAPEIDRETLIVA